MVFLNYITIYLSYLLRLLKNKMFGSVFNVTTTATMILSGEKIKYEDKFDSSTKPNMISSEGTSIFRTLSSGVHSHQPDPHPG